MIINNQVINEALSHLKKPEEKEIKFDLKEAEEVKGDSSKIISPILDKYNNGKVLLKAVIENYLFDICTILKDLNPDFISILKIYNILNDPYKKYILQSYFVLKDGKKPLNITRNDLKKMEIKIRLKFLYDKEYYYNNFIQNMLMIFKFIFKDMYIGQNILSTYFSMTTYNNHISDFCLCLKNIEEEFERLIKCHINSLLKENSKMDINSFKKIVKRAKLRIDDKLYNLYYQCKSNDEIYFSVKKLNLETYFDLECLLEDHLKALKLDGQFKELNVQNKELYSKIDELKKINNGLNDQIDGLKDQNNKLGSKVNGLENQNRGLNGQIDELKDQNNKLDSKVNGLENENRGLNDRIDELNGQIDELNDQIDELKDQNNKLDSKVNELENQNSGLNDQIDELKSENNKIKSTLSSVEKKVNFMEIIVNSALSRKIINHCIKGIVQKYKNQIKITLDEKGEFKIYFKANVRNVSVKDANDLINYLFSKKDVLNNNVHFVQINKPDFIKDIWSEFFKFIELKGDNLINFNKIVTEDIKNSFKFSQNDQAIKSFLKHEVNDDLKKKLIK